MAQLTFLHDPLELCQEATYVSPRIYEFALDKWPSCADLSGNVSGEDPVAKAGALDLQLTYLWRVHGCNYYGGTQLADPAECAFSIVGV